MNGSTNQGGGGNSALARVSRAVGSHRDAPVVTKLLEFASSAGHLISPATACPSLPEGCEVAITAVAIDIAHETYDVGGGKLGLAKSALDRIGSGVGITWDPIASRRLDNGSDPRYCHFRAVGHYRAFDGQLMTLKAEKEMDLREGSPQVDAIVERCVRKLGRDADGKPEHEVKKLGREKGENQIREMRLHILAHAESKAQLRAIRSMGVRASYERGELEKPFLMARVMFTGRTDDPVLRRAFAERTADAFLGGTRALYGAPEPVRGVIDVGTPPPPVGAIDVGEDDYVPTPPPADTKPEPEPRPAAAAPPAAPPSNGNGGSKPPAIDTSKFKIPGGEEKGVRLPDASDEALDYWHKRLAGDLADGKGNPQYARQDQARIDAFAAEIARRRNEVEQADAALGSDPELSDADGRF